jgi:hypothetical protein
MTARPREFCRRRVAARRDRAPRHAEDKGATAVDDKVVIGQTHAGDDAEAVLVEYLLGVEALRAGKQRSSSVSADGSSRLT